MPLALESLTASPEVPKNRFDLGQAGVISLVQHPGTVQEIVELRVAETFLWKPTEQRVILYPRPIGAGSPVEGWEKVVDQFPPALGGLGRARIRARAPEGCFPVLSPCHQVRWEMSASVSSSVAPLASRDT